MCEREEVRRMEQNLEELYNLPDLKFVQFCEWKFQLNRGIYNNIDNWFFEQGVHNIIQRRKAIIKFLHSIYKNERKIKFGTGGLKIKLEEFWNQSLVNI